MSRDDSIAASFPDCAPWEPDCDELAISAQSALRHSSRLVMILEHSNGILAVEPLMMSLLHHYHGYTVYTLTLQ